MSYEPVDVYVKDTSSLRLPVAGAVVRVFSQDGALSFSQATTDADGKASFLLPAPNTFQLRFFKQHVGFSNPLYLSVLEAPEVNVFDVPAELISPPTVPDTRLCVAYGFFRTPTGAAAPHVDLHFIPKFKPLLLDGDAVLVERAIVRTDARGYVQVPLIRFGQYDVTAQGTEDYRRIINVPDAANVNLPDLLFPVVGSILFSVDPIPSIPEGTEIYVTPTVYGTDGSVLDGGAMSDVNWSSSDTTVLSVQLAGGVLTLRGIAPGAASLRAVRVDQTIVRIPDTPIVGVPVTVTVT